MSTISKRLINKSFLPSIQTILPTKVFRRWQVVIAAHCEEGYIAGVPQGPLVYHTQLQPDNDNFPTNTYNLRGYLYLPKDAYFVPDPLRVDNGAGLFVTSNPQTFLMGVA
jgi:hypothetical protein